MIFFYAAIVVNHFNSQATKSTRADSPWELPYADAILMDGESLNNLDRIVYRWKVGLIRSGLIF